MGTKTQKLSNVVDQIVEWQAVVTADGSTGLTTVAGEGYFVNTTSGAITVTLPASPKAGDIVQLKDYARTWGTNAVTMASTTFDGVTNTPDFSTNGQTVTLVYMDGTKGWSLINEDTTTGLGAEFITATGGTVATSGDFKIHSFTGDADFVVSVIGNPAGSDKVDYLVVAGGGAGGTNGGGGGGAGGYRTTFPSPGCNAGSFPISVTTYPITVGAGGSAGYPVSTSGGISVFSTITSTGGGHGGGVDAPVAADSGGSGGGGGGHPAATKAGGAGNTPPVSPPQGNNGGTSPPGNSAGSGGGGASAAGVNAAPNAGTAGGAGSSNIIFDSPTVGTPGPAPGRYYAGGGGGGRGCAGAVGAGGVGGGGAGTTGGDTGGVAGTANTGGGGGGEGSATAFTGNGGSGIVIIRYKFQ